MIMFMLRSLFLQLIFFCIYTNVFAQSSEEERNSVVGNQRGYAARETKKGLVLLPFKYYFKSYDGDIVGEISGKNRNYKGGITKLSNTDSTSQNISLENFTNWANYDFIYLSTHGKNLNGCFSNGTKVAVANKDHCRTFIYTGIKIKDSLESLALKEKYAPIPGIVVGKTEIYITDLFLKHYYPSGTLQNKIIFIDACSIGQFSEIPEAFKSILKNSHLLYWTNPVYASDSYAAAENLFNKMTKEGLTLERAYDQMPAGLKTGLRSPSIKFELIDEDFDINMQEEVLITTDLKLLTVGEPQHLIEPVALLDAKNQKPLENNDKYVFAGIYGDDKPERLNIDVEIKGYTKSEIEQEKMTLSLRVNGKDVLSKQQLLPDEDPKDFIELVGTENEFVNRVKLMDLDIQQDLPKQKSVVIEAYFHLGEEQEGYQKLILSTGNPDLRIEMQGPDGRITILYDADIDGMKIEYPRQRKNMYVDEDGFAYANADGRWMKIDFKNMMRMAAMMPVPGVSGLNVAADLPSPMHKIPYFAAEITVNKLENMPNAKKISGDDAKNPVFLVNGTVRVEFDEDYRLLEIKDGSSNMKYFYEPQSISYPQATEMKIPFGF